MCSLKFVEKLANLHDNNQYINYEKKKWGKKANF